MNTTTRCRTLDECLQEWLQDPENAEAYFKVTIEEYLEDNDFDFFIHSLKNIAAAKSSVLQLTEEALNQNSLDVLLEEDPKPTWEKVLQALGYSLLEHSSEPVPSY